MDPYFSEIIGSLKNGDVAYVSDHKEPVGADGKRIVNLELDHKGQKATVYDLFSSDVAKFIPKAFLGRQLSKADLSALVPDWIFKGLAENPSISFRNPTDGCYARAQVMCDLIQKDYKMTPGRIWAFKKDGGPQLKVATNPIDPAGPKQVTWWYHVAATINVDGKTVVLDPSLCSGPVSPDQWKNVMSGVARIEETPLGVAPHRNDGTQYPGTGYWPGKNPPGGNLSAHAMNEMNGVDGFNNNKWNNPPSLPALSPPPPPPPAPGFLERWGWGRGDSWGAMEIGGWR